MDSRMKKENYSSNNAQQGNETEICELEHLRKLFIGGLSPATTEESLGNFYAKWGSIVDAVVMRDPATKRSKGFGFITYVKAASVDEAQNNRPHIIDGKAVDSKRALPRPERETKENNFSVRKLFVGGLKDNHDEESLKEYFKQFGDVISVKILTDKNTGKRRGFGYIEYDDYDAVDKAILQRIHTIKYVVVDVKKCVYNKDQQTANNNNKTNGTMPPAPQQPMPPYAAQGPPGPYPQPPYYYWGPPQYPPQYPTPYPPQYPPQYGPQQPMPPANGWPAAPPPAAVPPVAPNNWYPNAPAAAAPPNAPSTPNAPPNWNLPAQQQAPQPPQANNLGSGYQQNYGGGPKKPNQNDVSRMHPYGQPSNSNYANGGQQQQQPQQQGYNSYGQNNQRSTQNGSNGSYNNYRR